MSTFTKTPDFTYEQLVQMCSISPKTRQQIAAEYGIAPSTLRRKIREAGLELPAGTLLASSQKNIYEALGYPPDIKAEDYCKVDSQ